MRVEGSIGSLRRLGLPLAAVALAGCEGPASTLDPAGPGSAPITAVWWAMFWGSMAILIAMIALVLYAVYAPPHRRARVSGAVFIVGGGIVFPLTVVTALLVFGIFSGHALLPLPTDRAVERVEVVAHQWWWEIHYPEAAEDDTAAAQERPPLYTANELHIPVGRPVDIHLTSTDVIHAFWVPRLGGKIDALPDRTNVLRIEADEPGVYHGQCAEFCGLQHARMMLRVVAHDEEAYGDWLDGLETLAGSLPREEAAPDEERFQHGRDAFAEFCAECHSLDPAERSPVAPNLGNVFERERLGAGAIDMEPDGLVRWIADHQSYKPGNRMPVFDHLDDDTVGAVADYLKTDR